jgi:hypothetical protein
MYNVTNDSNTLWMEGKCVTKLWKFTMMDCGWGEWDRTHRREENISPIRFVRRLHHVRLVTAAAILRAGSALGCFLCFGHGFLVLEADAYDHDDEDDEDDDAGRGGRDLIKMLIDKTRTRSKATHIPSRTAVEIMNGMFVQIGG